VGVLARYLSEKLRFLVRFAILALGHNTQHRFFRVRGGRLAVIADRLRGLPVVDPHDRARVSSFGRRSRGAQGARAGREVALLPERKDPGLVVRIASGGERAPEAPPPVPARAPA
jgi:hypothetical protein